MSSPTQMLTARLTPVPGQALDCYLEHVAALNCLTTADLLTRLRALIPDASSPSFVQQTVLSPTSSELHAITALTGADPDQLHTAALASHAGTAFDLTGYDRTHRYSYRSVAARGWAPTLTHSRACSRCLADDATWRLHWRLPLITTCTRHHTPLISHCPDCARPLRSGSGLLRTNTAGPTCANPTGNPASRCTTNLAHTPTHTVDAHVLTTQERINAALGIDETQPGTRLAPTAIDALGVWQPARDYLADLQALTVLLLHLADSHPGTPRPTDDPARHDGDLFDAAATDNTLSPTPGTTDPAAQTAAAATGAGPDAAPDLSWADQLRTSATPTPRRPPARGTRRWHLRPPADPQVLGRAIAAADNILAAPSIEQAARRFAPWAERTPPAPEGRLGWLSDHTRMTPNLSSIVITAHAPRRRLSRRLDHPASTGRLDHPGPLLPLPAIPQLIPADHYHAHLAALLDTSAETGRMYAALCLARAHPTVTTWRDAATALDLPADLGSRTARTAQQRTTTPPGNLHQALIRLAEDLDPTISWRIEEAHIRHLARAPHTWLPAWSRQRRPGLRPSSAPYVITWRWTHEANAAMTTSPAWTQPPTARQRAAYRQFAASFITNEP